MHRLKAHNGLRPAAFDTMSWTCNQMALVNQYSFLLLSLVALVLLAFFLLRDGARGSDWAALASLALGLFLAYALLRPGRSTNQRAEEVLDRIGSGQAVLVELQSPYCLGCMAMRPLMDSIEREHAGRLVVIRLNVQESAGRTIADQVGLHATPSFLFFDATGREVWRSVGIIDPALVRQWLASP